MKTPANEPWIERSIALLEESAQSLDAVTVMRLNRARQAALAQNRRPWHGWAIGSSLAGATLALALALGLGHRTQAPAPSMTDGSEQVVGDAVVLSGDDSLDLYENLDFYVWLSDEQHGND